MTLISVSALFAQGETRLRRFREMGDLTLDLFHHDGRVADQWLGLLPEEFEIMWRLAREPDGISSGGEATNRQAEGTTNALQIKRLRARLQLFGLEDLIKRFPDGGYKTQSLQGPGKAA